MEYDKPAVFILITDDSAENRIAAIEYFQFLLPQAHLTEAEAGQQAVELVKKRIHQTGKNYDLILMDYQMPGWNGQEVTFKIRELETQMNLAEKSIIVTWSAAKTQPYQQADAVLKKPMTKDELEIVLIECGFLEWK